MTSQMNKLVVSIGELLIDFFCTDVDVRLKDGEHFLKQAGGAPANVCAAICKLGGQAAFVGKVGRDPFGDFLKQTLEGQGVDISMLIEDENSPTTLAFVSLQADGERDFVFNRGADRLLTYDDLDHDKLRQAKIVHFGSATALLEDPFRETYFKAMQDAKEEGIFTSFDPNYRENLWGESVARFISHSQRGIALADFVKVSEEELQIITSVNNRSEGVRILHDYGAKAVAVTLGKEGTLISNGIEEKVVPSIEVKSIDSTGAGDAFVGSVLFKLTNFNEPREVLQDIDKLERIIAYSNKVGAFVCTKVGAISALPTSDEILELY